VDAEALRSYAQRTQSLADKHADALGGQRLQPHVGKRGVHCGDDAARVCTGSVVHVKEDVALFGSSKMNLTPFCFLIFADRVTGV
jgi:hypothetical protein